LGLGLLFLCLAFCGVVSLLAASSLLVGGLAFNKVLLFKKNIIADYKKV